MSAKQTTPGLDEEYYQISPRILSSFPKFRPPLDLFIFKDTVGQIQPFKKAQERMDKQVQEQVAELCEEGMLFVARKDHPVYSKHIAKQLDLILVDDNLQATEIANIFKLALPERLKEFFEQPVKAVYELLHTDLMVLTEYLWTDKHRIKGLVRRMFTDHSLPNHSFNTGVLGLWLVNHVLPSDITRRTYDKIAQGLFLHDMGMAKVPSFILTKTGMLSPDEKEKIHAHPGQGSKIASKLDLKFDEMQQCTMEHHERLDGKGYPSKASDVSVVGGLCAVADSYAAMISKRIYAEAKDPKEAATELLQAKNKYPAKVTQALATAVLQDKW